mgnify:CR=1 FL=1
MLDNMHEDEYEKWVESLQKLLNGDRGMLDRADPGDSDTKQQPSRVTPAPVDMRKRVKATQGGTSGYLGRLDAHKEGVCMPLPENNGFIKREGIARSNLPEETPLKEATEDSIAETTTTIRQLSMNEHNARLLGAARMPAVEMMNQGFQRDKNVIGVRS